MDKQRGFTLIELIITLALIIIMGALAVPFFQSYAINTNLKSAARDIQSDFSSLKQRAISKNTAYAILFNAANNNYTFPREPDDVLITKTPASFGKDITITNAAFGGGSTITFQTRGTVSAGNVALNNSRGSTATINTTISGRTYVQFNLK